MDLLKDGKNEFILYPFGEEGMKVKGILKAVVDKLTVSVDPEKRSEKKILKGITTS